MPILSVLTQGARHEGEGGGEREGERRRGSEREIYCGCSWHMPPLTNHITAMDGRCVGADGGGGVGLGSVPENFDTWWGDPDSGSIGTVRFDKHLEAGYRVCGGGDGYTDSHPGIERGKPRQPRAMGSELQHAESG